MWFVMFLNNNNEVLHVIGTRDKPSDEDLAAFKQEVETDPEFNHISKKIKSIEVEEVKGDYDKCMEILKRLDKEGK